jgi:hypothetical protein
MARTILFAIVGSFFLLAAASKRTEAEPPIRVATVGLVHGHVKGFLAALPGNQAATLVAIVEPQEPPAKDYAAKYHLDAKRFTSISEAGTPIGPVEIWIPLEPLSRD